MHLKKKITLTIFVVVILASVCGYYFYGRHGNDYAYHSESQYSQLASISISEELTSASISEGYANAQLLVDDAWVLGRLDDHYVRIIDVRSEQDYVRGHIRNAVSLEFEELRATVDGITNVAPKDKVESVLGNLGLTHEVTVVIYDESESMDAALVFWTLEYYGHTDVRILDGGLRSWIDNGNPTTKENSKYEKTTYEAVIRPEILATAEFVLDNLENPKVVIVDNRSPEEYEKGHIPGAVNIELKRNLNSNGEFKSATELLEVYNDLGVTKDLEVVTYCGSGRRASHTYFALRLLGYTVRTYDGSWEE